MTSHELRIIELVCRDIRTDAEAVYHDVAIDNGVTCSLSVCIGLKSIVAALEIIEAILESAENREA